MSLVKLACENELIKEAEYLEKVAADLNECSDEDLVKIAEEVIGTLEDEDLLKIAEAYLNGELEKDAFIGALARGIGRIAGIGMRGGQAVAGAAKAGAGMVANAAKTGAGAVKAGVAATKSAVGTGVEKGVNTLSKGIGVVQNVGNKINTGIGNAVANVADKADAATAALKNKVTAIKTNAADQFRKGMEAPARATRLQEVNAQRAFNRDVRSRVMNQSYAARNAPVIALGNTPSFTFS